jgi:polyhydroxybutyrate depolymerase
MPLVLVLHGAGGAKEYVLDQYRWADKADKEGFLAVAAEATPIDPSKPATFATNPRVWNDGSGRSPQAKRNVNDAGYLAAVIQDVIKRAGGNPKRVYVTGFSSGASMTHHMGFLYPNLVGAIAPISGHLWDEGKLARPLPVLSIAGSVDPLNPLEGGPAVNPWSSGKSERKEAMIASLERWARLDGCKDDPVRTKPSEKVSLTSWTGCSGGAEVRFYVVQGLGHQWPGAKNPPFPKLFGPGSDALDATDIIWDFFRTKSAVGQVPDLPWASAGKMKFGVIADFASYQSPFKPSFGPEFDAAHNRIARLMAYEPPPQILFKWLNALYETGAGIIRIDFFFDPWLLENSSDSKERQWAEDHRSAFDQVVRKIHQDGKELFIADAGAGYYATFGSKRNHTHQWKEFRSAQKHQVATLARRYQPDYYEVVKEYRWYTDWGIIDTEPTPEEWSAQTEDLCATVKEIDPRAKVAVGLIARSKLDAAVGQLVAKSPCVDIIGIDIYGLKDLEAMPLDRFTGFVHEHGKQAWLAETWSSLQGSYGAPKREENDAKWIRYVVEAARQQHMDGFIPFFSSHFFFYDMPPGWDTVKPGELSDVFTRYFERALDQRTAVFRAYREEIRGE